MKANMKAKQPEVIVHEKTLLDEIVEHQAQIGARYKPAMSIEEAVERKKTLDHFIANLLKEGEDYGVIPGTKSKPCLLKPGAEKLCAFFGYAPCYTVEKTEDWTGADHEGEPFFHYSYNCTLKKDGYPVGQGEGSCNSWETKYRYRQGERVCPKCQKPTIIKGKTEYGGGWLCFAKKGGCGAKFGESDKAITGQDTGRVTNAEIYDQVNTLQKMAQKRAYIAATLSATGASQYFTQDLEDLHAQNDPKPDTKPEPPDDFRRAMAILEPAAMNGREDFELAWNTLSKTMKSLVKADEVALEHLESKVKDAAKAKSEQVETEIVEPAF